MKCCICHKKGPVIEIPKNGIDKEDGVITVCAEDQRCKLEGWKLVDPKE